MIQVPRKWRVFALVVMTLATVYYLVYDRNIDIPQQISASKSVLSNGGNDHVITKSEQIELEETASYLFGPEFSLTKDTPFLESLPHTREARCSSENWIRGWKYAPNVAAPKTEIPPVNRSSSRCFARWEGYGDNPSILRECLRNRSLLVVGDSWAREFVVELARVVNQTELELVDDSAYWRPEVSIPDIGDCRVQKIAKVDSFHNVTTEACGAHASNFFGSGAAGLHESCGVVVPQVMRIPSYNFTVTFIFKSYLWTPLVENALEEVLLGPGGGEESVNGIDHGFDALLLYIGRWPETRIPMQRKFGMISPNETGKCFEEQLVNYYNWLYNLTSRVRLPIINMQTAMMKGNCTETPSASISPWWNLKNEAKPIVNKLMPGAVYVPVGDIQRVKKSAGGHIGHGLAGPIETWICLNVAHIICQMFGRCSSVIDDSE